MRKIRLALLINLLLTTLAISAQQAIGNWQSYLSYHNVTKTAVAGNIVYALGNGGLFAYDTEDESVQTYYKSNMLNDTEIVDMAYCAPHKTLLVVYSNANIDLIINNREVYNLPDYMNKNITPKDVNSISFNGDYAYMATSFGIIVVNLNKREISNAYILNQKIHTAVSDGNYIYAASEQGLLTGKLTDNLLDINKWNKVSETVFHLLSIVNNSIIGYINNDGLKLINQNDFSYSQLVNGTFNYFNQTENGTLLAGNNSQLWIIRSPQDITRIDHNQNIAYFSADKNTYWGACYENGLQGYRLNTNGPSLEQTVHTILPNSPQRNLIGGLKIEGERLYVTGGGITLNRLWNPGTLMMLENNTWTNYPEQSISEKTGLPYQDITSVVQDPLNPEHVFAASAGEGLYEFLNGEFQTLHNRYNSPLETSWSDPEYIDKFVRVNALTYYDGNLWMTNSGGEVVNNVKVMKPDKQWFQLCYPEIQDKVNLKQLLFDNQGWFWILSTNAVSSSGVFCANLNDTPENAADDQHTFIHTLTNQDGTALNDYRMLCMALDKEGAIWIGTNMGPVVISNPSRVFDNNFYCTQIKVPRNDGTNYADFLLASEVINSIAIDGANRKWIGTESNGIYLISADGLETIQHFTQENSPLISNNITAIAIHPTTGEVFIGTNKGLVSYQGDATEGGETFAEDVYAYPNPVYPDYSGVITVTGLVRDSDVKITNTNGKMVYSGTSTGGLFTWNGTNQNGQKVPSGVYFVLAAKADGSEGVVCKIVIVR